MSTSTSPRFTKVAEADFPTELGVFRIFGFEAPAGDEMEEAVVLKMGDFANGAPPLVRIHSQCLTGDVFGSLRCDCRQQLELALQMISEEGRGVPQNFERAAGNYRRACEERNGEACARLAALYDKGAGVDRAPERAKSLRRQACEYGYADACPQRPEKTS